ncbi:hypothetical protein scyTo_0020068 [Scyliorhinus torazame]|uniref:SEA domain-containing protein n=1 Tax=Scyliorhinus torazame TaxID=75743 RepID=A0A401PYE4_SCYTO|nr:hypothetical protein [Scyliorhinus torazame]
MTSTGLESTSESSSTDTPAATSSPNLSTTSTGPWTSEGTSSTGQQSTGQSTSTDTTTLTSSPNVSTKSTGASTSGGMTSTGLESTSESSSTDTPAATSSPNRSTTSTGPWTSEGTSSTGQQSTGQSTSTDTTALTSSPDVSTKSTGASTSGEMTSTGLESTSESSSTDTPAATSSPNLSTTSTGPWTSEVYVKEFKYQSREHVEYIHCFNVAKNCSLFMHKKITEKLIYVKMEVPRMVCSAFAQSLIKDRTVNQYLSLFLMKLVYGHIYGYDTVEITMTSPGSIITDHKAIFNIEAPTFHDSMIKITEQDIKQTLQHRNCTNSNKLGLQLTPNFKNVSYSNEDLIGEFCIFTTTPYKLSGNYIGARCDTSKDYWYIGEKCQFPVHILTLIVVTAAVALIIIIVLIVAIICCTRYRHLDKKYAMFRRKTDKQNTVWWEEDTWDWHKREGLTLGNPSAGNWHAKCEDVKCSYIGTDNVVELCVTEMKLDKEAVLTQTL